MSGGATFDPGCEAVRELLPLRFYGLVEGADVATLARHLERCAACAREWEEIRTALSSVAADAAFPREREVDWKAFARATVDKARAAERARPRKAMRPLVWGGWLAAAAALLIVAGLSLRRPATGPAGPESSSAASGLSAGAAPGGSAAVSDGGARYLQESLARQGAARYLRDSRTLLVDLVHAPVRCRRSDGSLDIALEKERSRELLRRKNLYLDALREPQDTRLAQLMQQLETLLIQVSSLDDCAAAQQIHDLRSEIERRQILMRIDLISREVLEGGARA